MTQQTKDLGPELTVLDLSLRFHEMIKRTDLTTEQVASAFARTIARSIHKFAESGETFYTHQVTDRRAMNVLNVSFQLQVVDHKYVLVEILNRMSPDKLMSQLVPERSFGILDRFIAEFWKTMRGSQMDAPVGERDKLVTYVKDESCFFLVSLDVPDMAPATAP